MTPPRPPKPPRDRGRRLHLPRRRRDPAHHRLRETLGDESRHGRIALLVVGLVLLGIVAAELITVTILDREAGMAMWRGTGVEMFAGREAGIPLSLGGDAPPWLVAQVSTTQDVGVVCLAYPAFLWLLTRYHDRDNLLMRRLRKLEERAMKHEPFIRRWGPFGVFLFMLVPFLLNGPLVGAVLGRTVGVPTRFLIVPVVAATAVAAFAWTYAYDTLFGLVGDLHPAIPPVLTGIIVVGIVGWNILGEVREARRLKAEGSS